MIARSALPGVATVVSLWFAVAMGTVAGEEVDLSAELANVTTIAVVPVRVLPFEPDADQAQLMATAIEKDLEARGFEVVSATEFESVWLPKVQAMGGIYDPYTGERREEAYSEALAHTDQILSERHQVQAYLLADVVPVEANAGSFNVSWDGQKVKIGSIWQGSQNDGRVVPALTMTVRLMNSRQKVLYQGRGGLELLVLVNRKSIEDVKQVDLLRDSAKIEQAVALANSALRPRSDPSATDTSRARR